MSTFTIKKGFVNGFALSQNAAAPDYKVDIQAGECADSTAQRQIKSDSVLTVDLSASGANGLDTSSEAADTWYAVHVIADTSGANAPAGLFSTSATSPTLPSGYDIFRRIGWVRNDSSADLLSFLQIGSSNTREYVYRESMTGVLRVLQAGTATGATDVDCSSLMPSTSRLAQIHVENQSDDANLRVTENNITPTMRLIRPDRQQASIMVTDDSQVLDYHFVSSPSGGGANISVLSFLEAL